MCGAPDRAGGLRRDGRARGRGACSPLSARASVEGAPAPYAPLSPPEPCSATGVRESGRAGPRRRSAPGPVRRLRAGREGRRHSLLIARDRRLAVEEYFAASSREDVHTVQSVTKSVTSLLAGIQRDDGRLDLDGTAAGAGGQWIFVVRPLDFGSSSPPTRRTGTSCARWTCSTPTSCRRWPADVALAP